MKLNYREFFMQKMVVLLKPGDIESSAKDFLSMYASYMESVGIIGKGPDGYTSYQSRTAPVEEKNVSFFEEWVELTNALGIKNVIGMDLYTDGWFARDPKYQTMTAEGQPMEHQICPNRESFWQYGAEIIKEIGAYPIEEIILFGTGFIRDRFCFCEKCRADFAPLVGQEPSRLTYAYITENPDYHDQWHKWRQEKVNEGLKYLRSAAREIDDAVGRELPLRLAVEVLLDPETGFSEGAKTEYGYDYARIGDITSNVVINLYPWSPILPQKGTAEYDTLVESLYFTNEFSRRGGRASLFRWGVTTLEQMQELKTLAADAGLERVVISMHYPTDYSRRRESAIGNF